MYQQLISAVEAMKKVEGIKQKRQAHFIRERQHKARAIERMKDVKEVQRDLALIKSPAAGLKRPAKEMDVEEDDDIIEDEDFGNTSLDLKTLNKKKAPTRAKAKVAKIITEVEADAEMEEI